MTRARISRTLLDLVAADRRTRLGAAADLITDAAAFAAALRGEVAPTAKRLQPVERRRALTVVIEIWRDLGRDLALAAHGHDRGIHDLDQLEDLQAAADGLDPLALVRFLDRLDRLSVAIEGYASPELTLDVLLLTWPRAASSGRSVS